MGVHYMVLPELAALGHPIEMPSDDSESDWIYAADAAEAWWRAMITPAPPRPVYNLAAERRRMADVTAYLRKLLPEARIGVSDKRIPNIANMNCENLMKDLDFKPRYTMERPALRNTSTLFANPPASRQSKHKTKRARRKTRPLRSNPRTILIGCCSSSWRHPPAHWRASSVADPSA
jgi:hypothetical protein